ncbi:MAG: hypothetical protein DMF86_07060 [Acidobacteria bacterium]|nr:MAG: hypothetical protein DMF86_07060 [Acidobacteriota bacterium]
MGSVARRLHLSGTMRYQIASLLAIAIVTLAFGGYAAAAQKPKSESTRKKPGVNPDAQVIVDFNKRINAYVELHKKLEATLPTLPKEATPQQIDVHERALAKLVQAARADAKPGDLFSPGMQVIVRRILGQVFRGPDGRQIKNSILDESGERAVVKLTINGRYPDEVPISTVPPQVLLSLPKLPDILLDVHAHTIADFIDNAFP